MAEIKDARQILTEVRRFLRFIQPGLDTSQNSILSNLLLFPASIVGQILNAELDRIQQLQIVSGLAGEDLDNEASNFGMTRDLGRRSRGFVIFFTSTQPVADIVIPAGTIVGTVTFNLNQTVSFRTITTIRFLGGPAAENFFNTDTQRYESFRVPIEAVDQGVASNVGENRITLLQGPLNGIEGVTNRDAVIGGQDVETDDVFRERIQRRYLGRERNIRKGLESYLKNTFDFADAQTLRVLDEVSERATGIDVFVIDDNPTETSPSLVHDTLIDVYRLAVRPMLSVSSVIRGTVAAPGASLVEGEHYEVERDVGTTLRFSTQSFDQVRILPAGHAVMADGETFTITYLYSNEVARAQAALNREEERILTADPLIKRALRFGAEIRAGISFFGGVDINVEREKIRFALINFFDTLLLGSPIEKSDLIVVMQTGVSGIRIQSVDQVVIEEVTATNELGDVRLLTDDITGESIEFSGKEFARFDNLTITAIL